MIRIASTLLVAAACAYSMNASAGSCDSPWFDLKGSKHGVTFGDCACTGGRVIHNVSREQCYQDIATEPGPTPAGAWDNGASTQAKGLATAQQNGWVDHPHSESGYLGGRNRAAGRASDSTQDEVLR
ncbi:hypothetical protein QFZ89_005356 [Paraburkholderia youngii]